MLIYFANFGCFPPRERLLARRLISYADASVRDLVEFHRTNTEGGLGEQRDALR